MAHAFGSLDELGEGYGFRKIRRALGVTAFGVNALVMPAGAEGIHHYHDVQDELYFVHRGTGRFEVDGEPMDEAAGVGIGDDHSHGRGGVRGAGPGQRRGDVVRVAGVPGRDLAALGEGGAGDGEHRYGPSRG